MADVCTVSPLSFVLIRLLSPAALSVPSSVMWCSECELTEKGSGSSSGVARGADRPGRQSGGAAKIWVITVKMGDENGKNGVITAKMG